MVKQIQLCKVNRIVYGDLPVYFCKYFNCIRDTHSHSTRGSSMDFVPDFVPHIFHQQAFIVVLGKTSQQPMDGLVVGYQLANVSLLIC